jgi:hypothetical protein
MGIREYYLATCDTCGTRAGTRPHDTTSAAETAATTTGWHINPDGQWGDRVHCPDCQKTSTPLNPVEQHDTQGD